MKDAKTQAVIDHYFELMGRGEDFAACYAADVQWTTFDGGTKILGPKEVRDYLTGLHRNMPDIRTRPRAYADETAYVEGDCADPRSTSNDRIAFCVAYDVANGVITSARCYERSDSSAQSAGRIQPSKQEDHRARQGSARSCSSSVVADSDCQSTLGHRSSAIRSQLVPAVAGVSAGGGDGTP